MAIAVDDDQVFGRCTMYSAHVQSFSLSCFEVGYVQVPVQFNSAHAAFPTQFESGININGMLSDLCARACVCVYVRVQACVCACACVRADKRR